MKTMLVTGGTVFVSRYVEEYYVAQGYDVYVLNRNTRSQAAGVHLIQCDRNAIGNRLKHLWFDVVVDVTAYHPQDIINLVEALDGWGDYIMISSSAVYPEYGTQPFLEEDKVAENSFWGKYGLDKLYAEKALLERVPDAYILRPPYLYGPMNNVYREAFVFECALKERPFYLPGDGSMKLQFFHVKDLCRFIDCILEHRPDTHIFNVGNREAVSVKDWVEICYSVAGKRPQYVHIYDDVEQRNYFSFYNYEYYLDVEKMHRLLPATMPLHEGLQEAYAWYIGNSDKVQRKPLISYIDEFLERT